MNDLRTLIDLCPGTRLPQNEEEIFADNDLTDYYLRKLCEQYDWYYHADSLSAMGYFYALGVMKSRWPEAEHLITTNPEWAYRYARYVMKSRWPEAEAIIATDPQCAYCYAVNVMKSRWPEAEAVIAASEFRKWYNRDFGINI